MLFNPNNYFPDTVDIDKVKLREACFLILTALGELPGDTYSTFDTGEMVALGDNGIGPAPVSTGTVPIKAGGRALGHVRTNDIDLGATLTLTDSGHLGSWLRKTDSESCLIALEAHTDPTIGVLQGFKCALWRRSGAGSIQISSSLTNTHLLGHSHVASNGIVTLTVDTVLREWSLHGETEA